jgi:hypothetical protein
MRLQLDYIKSLVVIKRIMTNELSAKSFSYTDEQLLAMAMANIGEYIHDNSPQYILIEDDPRNEDDYDTWEVGMEPIPGDQTWKSTAIDIESSEVND